MTEEIYVPGIILLGDNDKRGELRNIIQSLISKSAKASELITKLSCLLSKSNETIRIMLGPTTFGADFLTLLKYGRQITSYTAFENGKKLIVIDQVDADILGVPIEVGLAHELIHALHGIENTNTHDANEEYRTIGLDRYSSEYFSENAIRQEMGVKQRLSY